MKGKEIMTIINRIHDIKQLKICLDIIHKSFKTVAQDFNLTKENCPGHTSFMTIDKLENQFKENKPMFLYTKENEFVGYFSLGKNNEKSYELDNLAVLPDYRHFGNGKEMVNYAITYVSNTYNPVSCLTNFLRNLEESRLLRIFHFRSFEDP